MAADETTRRESPDSNPQIRLRVDLVMEIADPAALTTSALARVEGDELMPDEERAHARETVAADAGEAIAYLVDPFDLVRELPGVQLAHASWGSEEVGEGGFDAFADLDDPGGEPAGAADAERESVGGAGSAAGGRRN
jgi:hypothetical protein